MNNQRRKELNRISTEMSAADTDDLESIKSDIEMVLMDEEMAFENMPEVYMKLNLRKILDSTFLSESCLKFT